MKKGIIGKKLGMTQIFDEKGNVIPVTLIEAGPCVVAQKKTVENDGYDAIQLGFMDAKAKHMTKAEQGHFGKNGLQIKKHLKEFRYDDCSKYNVGDVITVTATSTWVNPSGDTSSFSDTATATIIAPVAQGAKECAVSTDPYITYTDETEEATASE